MGKDGSTTILKENSLKQHRRGQILGMVRLALAFPLRTLRVVRASLTTTDGNGLFSSCTTATNREQLTLANNVA